MTAKIITLALICLVNFAFSQELQPFRESVKHLAHSIEAQNATKRKAFVAILQFYNEKQMVTRFSYVIQDEFNLAFRDGNGIEIISQSLVNEQFERNEWALNDCLNFRSLTELSEKLFEKVKHIPDAFIYGTYTHSGNVVKLSVYYIPYGIASNGYELKTQFFVEEDLEGLLW